MAVQRNEQHIGSATETSSFEFDLTLVYVCTAYFCVKPVKSEYFVAVAHSLFFLQKITPYPQILQFRIFHVITLSYFTYKFRVRSFDVRFHVNKTIAKLAFHQNADIGSSCPNLSITIGDTPQSFKIKRLFICLRQRILIPCF